VTGDDRALALAGPPGDGAADGPVVHLGSADEAADVLWLPGAAPAAAAGARVIATSGDGLWSRAPWPARDDLFDLRPAATPLVLVAGGEDAIRERVAEKLAQRPLPARAEPELTAAGLAEATVVILLGPAGAATDEEPLRAAALPAEAPAVLAARRVLIAPRAAVTFGLLPGTDHLAFSNEDDAVQYADAACSFPESFEAFRVLGAVAAEPHRASRVYERLAGELAAG
jgi:hypothetical protein